MIAYGMVNIFMRLGEVSCLQNFSKNLPIDKTLWIRRILSPFKMMFFFYICLFIFSGSAAQRRLWPPHSRGFVITHNDAPQSVKFLWARDQLVAETST
jgi:hypothetical protein